MIITPRIPGTHAGKEPYRSFLSPRRRRQPLDPCLSSSRSSEVKEIINGTNLSSDKNGDLNISKKKYSPGPLACRDRGTFHLNISLSLLPARSESWLYCRNYNRIHGGQVPYYKCLLCSSFGQKKRFNAHIRRTYELVHTMIHIYVHGCRCL